MKVVKGLIDNTDNNDDNDCHDSDSVHEYGHAFRHNHYDDGDECDGNDDNVDNDHNDNDDYDSIKRSNTGAHILHLHVQVGEAYLIKCLLQLREETLRPCQLNNAMTPGEERPNHCMRVDSISLSSPSP